MQAALMWGGPFMAADHLWHDSAKVYITCVYVCVCMCVCVYVLQQLISKLEKGGKQLPAEERNKIMKVHRMY